MSSQNYDCSVIRRTLYLYELFEKPSSLFEGEGVVEADFGGENHTSVMRSMTISSSGRSDASVAADSILWTTSMPSPRRPKTVFLVSRKLLSTALIKD